MQHSDVPDSTAFESLRDSPRKVDFDEPVLSSAKKRTFQVCWVVATVGSAGLFLASLYLPAFYTRSGDAKGIFLLALGWFGVLQLQFAWFANPFFVFGWVALCFRQYHWTVLCGLAAIVIAAQSFFMKTWYNDGFDAVPVTGFGSGIYCWMGSFLLLLLGGAILVPSMDPRRYA